MASGFQGVLPTIPLGAGYDARKAALCARVAGRGTSIAGLNSTDRKIREVALAAVESDGRALQWLHPSFRKDKDVVMAAVSQDGYALRYVSKGLKQDREIVSAAVQQNGLALHFASRELQQDEGIVKEACCQNGDALQFATRSLRSDRTCRDIAQETGLTSTSFFSVPAALWSSKMSKSGSGRLRSGGASLGIITDGRWPSMDGWSHLSSLKATESSKKNSVAPTRQERRLAERRGGISGGLVPLDPRTLKVKKLDTWDA